MDTRIRPASTSDADRLAVLAAQVWLDTYATAGIDDEIAAYVLGHLTPARYRTAFAQGSTGVLVAERQGSLVGFASLTFGAACPSDARATVELETLYVQLPFLGHGIGAALLARAEADARTRTGGALWLTVYAGNARAIRFYARHGYTRIGSAEFAMGARRHENHVLVGPRVIEAAATIDRTPHRGST